jgi:sulfonate transport system ATP-binding protein
VLPGAAPAIFAGLRLALIYAWLGTIGAEYFMPSDGGIGSLMIGAQQLFRMDLVMAAMLLVGLVGALLGPSANASNRAPRAGDTHERPHFPAAGELPPGRQDLSRGRPRTGGHPRFDLDIAEGEFIAIVGASGCGKSTLLRLLVGLDREYSGEIRVDGQPSRHRRRARHRVPGAPPVPLADRAQNIGLGLVNEPLSQGARRAGRRFLSWWAWSASAAYPHQLSGGMAQRVAIARGLVASPRILLLDEPFGALDALTRQQCRTSCWHPRARTHHHGAGDPRCRGGAFLADRVVVMAPRPGRIKRIVEVPLAHPRERSGFDFLRLREALLHD